MIEERAVVARIEGQDVWVRASGPESCQRCAEGRGCGGGVIAKLVSRQRPEVSVRGFLGGLRIGDAVIVGVEESAIMKASVWVYLVPLIGMFAGGAFASLALEANDGIVAGFGVTGLLAGFIVTHMVGQRAEFSGHYRPTLLRRADSFADCARIPLNL